MVEEASLRGHFVSKTKADAAPTLHGERKGIVTTYLSNLLLVQHTCPGPCSRSHCMSDNVPVSHGMRF